jgi:hypothetical protein
MQFCSAEYFVEDFLIVFTQSAAEL